MLRQYASLPRSRQINAKLEGNRQKEKDKKKEEKENKRLYNTLSPAVNHISLW